jgi:polyisoprenoid-binding protein YceI
MSNLATLPFTGTYHAQAGASTFAFAVRHSETFWYRGRLPEVEATLRADDDGLLLEGAAKVESITIVQPKEMRAHVLGAEFFDAERHPDVSFRSTDLRLDGEGGLELDGELTIKGITRPVGATGRYSAPRQAAFGEIAGIELHTAFDRREFGFDWQMELPGGGISVGWEVQIDIDLLLLPEAVEA